MTKYRLHADTLRNRAREVGDDTGYAIARRTGLNESVVSRILRGRVSPGAKTLLTLSRIYDLSVEELVEETAA
jgi:transcriptional regulator with XRE-family HTH domain